MASIEASSSALSLYSSQPSSSRFRLCLKQTPSSLNLRISTFLPLSLRLASYPIHSLSRCSSSKSRFVMQYASEGEVALLENSAQPEDTLQKKKLYVVNLPFNLPSGEIKNRFGECGTVKDVEELSGRTIRVAYAKKFKKPRPSPPADNPVKETRYVLYVSNLQWKARSTHLRDFFSANFNPVSARVVFDSPSGRSAGYGFVSFKTREEAESAISACDGKELLGRPIRLKFSEKASDEPEHERDGEETSNGSEDVQKEGQP